MKKKDPELSVSYANAEILVLKFNNFSFIKAKNWKYLSGILFSAKYGLFSVLSFIYLLMMIWGSFLLGQLFDLILLVFVLMELFTLCYDCIHISCPYLN